MSEYRMIRVHELVYEKIQEAKNDIVLRQLKHPKRGEFVGPPSVSEIITMALRALKKEKKS